MYLQQTQFYTRLKDHPANITVKIDGWAASAATIIAMAGDTIKIAKNGVFMIHDPAMTVWDTFKAEDFHEAGRGIESDKTIYCEHLCNEDREDRAGNFRFYVGRKLVDW